MFKYSDVGLDPTWILVVVRNLFRKKVNKMHIGVHFVHNLKQKMASEQEMPNYASNNHKISEIKKELSCS